MFVEVLNSQAFVFRQQFCVENLPHLCMIKVMVMFLTGIEIR